MSSDERTTRWWPVGEPPAGVPHRAGEMISAVLGPITTAELIDALELLEYEETSSLPHLLEDLQFQNHDWPPAEIDHIDERPASRVRLPTAGPTEPATPGVLSTQDARGLARLVAAAVQHLHIELAGPPLPFISVIDPTPEDDPCFWNHRSDYRYELDLLRVLTEAPEATWSRLTPARRICLVADLGELLRIMIHLGQAEGISETARALAQVCDGDKDLVEVARIAGESLHHSGSRQAFDKMIDRVRSWEQLL